MATPKPTRPNLWAQAEHGDGGPTGRVKVFRVTEEQTRRGWDVQWDTRELLMTLDTTDAAMFIAHLGRALAQANETNGKD
jgi:hypothetical protein